MWQSLIYRKCFFELQTLIKSFWTAVHKTKCLHFYFIIFLKFAASRKQTCPSLISGKQSCFSAYLSSFVSYFSQICSWPSCLTFLQLRHRETVQLLKVMRHRSSSCYWILFFAYLGRRNVQKCMCRKKVRLKMFTTTLWQMYSAYSV